MPTLQLVHDGLAKTLLLYLLAIALWGIALWRTGSGVTPSYRGALVIAEVIAVAQGAAGALLSFGAPLREPLHVLYGLSIVLTLPLAYTYGRGKPPARQSLIYGLASLFAVGLTIRGMQTG